MRHITGERAYRIVQLMHVRSRLGYSGHIDDNILHIFNELPVADQKALLQVAVRVWSDHRTEPEKFNIPDEKIQKAEKVHFDDDGKVAEDEPKEMVQLKGWALTLTAVVAIVLMLFLMWLFMYTITVTPVPGEDSVDAVFGFLFKLVGVE